MGRQHSVYERSIAESDDGGGRREAGRLRQHAAAGAVNGCLAGQLEGIAAVGIYTLALSAIFWFAIKATLGLRVGAAEEEEGLDFGEHGQVAYTGFTTLQM